MRNIHYISAGAGSGKTHTLTEILADHIASGFCRPGEVLLTTFTEAAASEFREKTRRKLLEKGLVDAAFEMAGARIGTIHSVAKSLIDRYWYRLGLAPSVTVLDDEGRTRHINESLAALATDDDLRAFRRLQRCFGFTRQEGLYQVSNPDFWKQHLERILAWMDNYEVSLEESLDYCRRQFDAFFLMHPGDTSLEAQLEQVKSYLQAVSNSGETSRTTRNNIAPLLALSVEEESYVFTVKALSTVGNLPKKLQNKPFAPGYVQVCETLEKSLRHVSHGRLLKDYVERIFRLAPRLCRLQTAQPSDRLQRYGALLGAAARPGGGGPRHSQIDPAGAGRRVSGLQPDRDPPLRPFVGDRRRVGLGRRYEAVDLRLSAEAMPK